MTRNPKIETFGDCRRSFAGWPPGARYLENPLSSRRVQTVLFFYLFSSSVKVGQFHCICLLASRGGNSGGGETGSGPSWQHIHASPYTCVAWYYFHQKISQLLVQKFIINKPTCTVVPSNYSFIVLHVARLINLS